MSRSYNVAAGPAQEGATRNFWHARLAGYPNLRWDQRIAVNIGWEIRGRPLWLVTDDGDFARAAEAAGHSDCVHTLADYEQWLGVRGAV